MLPPVPRGIVPFPVSPGVSLTEFEALIADEPDEVAAAFDHAGSLVLLARRGTPISVEFDLSEAAALRDTTVTHVHPLGGPFSGGDARFCVDNDIAELRIVLPSGALYRMSRPGDGWPDRQRMTAAAEDAAEALSEVANLTMKEYEREVFGRQRIAFATIGVNIVRERWR